MAENQPQGKVHWLRLALIGVAFVGVSIGMGYLFEGLLSSVKISENIPMWIGLAVVFGLMIAINLTLLPLPFGVSLMIAAAGFWNPVLVGLAGSLGATLGEVSGYFFGTLGKRVSIGENVPSY